MHRMIKRPDGAVTDVVADPLDPPVEILAPARPANGVVFASPHSGSVYPEAFLRAAALDPISLRSSEDAFVDELFNAAPNHGAPLLLARFPRAYVDANREPWELDPTMFDGALPVWAKTSTPRVAAGLGAVPRVVAEGAEIYNALLPASEAERRIRAYHQPYHRTLGRLLTAAGETFGAALLIDCHSMPSVAAGGCDGPDIVLGDRFGAACHNELLRRCEGVLRGLGLSVTRNAPYAGGYSTERYGRPADGVHAIQVEISRRLYMDERRVARDDGFSALQSRMTDFIAEATQWDLAALTT